MLFFASINRQYYTNLNYDWLYYFSDYDKDKIIDGCEIYININDSEEKNYILNLFNNPLAKRWMYQFHGPDLERDNINHMKLLEYYNSISQKLGCTVAVNFHPVSSCPDIRDNITATKNELYLILDIIQKYNLNLAISLENLNKTLGASRCNLDEIYEILDIENVNLTWDIGHEVSDKQLTYFVNDKYINKLCNVHIHDINGSDHYPFYYKQIDLNRCFDYLNKINYSGPIVSEIGLNCLKSLSFGDKIKEYVENIQTLIHCNLISKQKGHQ